MSEIRKLIKELVLPLIPKQSITCKVSSVDTTKCSIDCEPTDGRATMFNVRLKANIDSQAVGFVLFPKVGSVVVVSLLWGNVNNAYVALVNEVDSVLLLIGSVFKLEVKTNGDWIWNSGNLGGIVKAGAAAQKLANLEGKCNSILAALHGVVIPLAPSGTYPFAPLFASITAIAPTTIQADLENTKIKH